MVAHSVLTGGLATAQALHYSILQCIHSAEHRNGWTSRTSHESAAGHLTCVCSYLQETLPHYRQVSEAYFNAITALGMRLLRLLALALDLPPEHFHPMFSRPMLFLRPLHYAPRKSQPEKARHSHISRPSLATACQSDCLRYACTLSRKGMQGYLLMSLLTTRLPACRQANPHQHPCSICIREVRALQYVPWRVIP